METMKAYLAALRDRVEVFKCLDNLFSIRKSSTSDIYFCIDFMTQR
jgi:hypothetical protein